MSQQSSPVSPFDLSAEQLVVRARANYKKLIENGTNAYALGYYILSDLGMAKVDFNALDPKGNRTAAEMKEEFYAFYRKAGLKEIRVELSTLNSSESVKRIEYIMGDLGFTAAHVLNDGENKFSVEEAATELAGRFRAVHLKETKEALQGRPVPSKEEMEFVSWNGRSGRLLDKMQEYGFVPADLVSPPDTVLSPKEADGLFLPKLRSLRIQEVRDVLSDLKDGFRVNLAKRLIKKFDLTAADVLNVDGVNFSPKKARAALECKFRDAYIDGARSYARDMNQDVDPGSKQAGANLAGQALLNAGVNADKNRDRKYSVDEINDALRNLPKCDSGPEIISAR